MERFVAAGGRRTATRQAIVEAIVEKGGHVTADEVAETVQRRFPSVNLSTVYRTLEALTDLDVLHHVHLGHGRAVFHLTEEGHQHLFCERCGRVQELPSEEFDDLRTMLIERHGFVMDDRHFAMVGLCRDCRSASVSR